jgi:hypothetical protein
MAWDERTELAARATTDATARIVSAPHKRPLLELSEQAGGDDDESDDGDSESGGCGLDISFLRGLIWRCTCGDALAALQNAAYHQRISPAAESLDPRQVPAGECITPEREIGNY